MRYVKTILMAARSPLLAWIFRRVTISSMSSGENASSIRCRSAAIRRLNGLPGPPLLFFAKRPSAVRPVLGTVSAGSGAVLVERVISGGVDMADPFRKEMKRDVEVTNDGRAP